MNDTYYVDRAMHNLSVCLRYRYQEQVNKLLEYIGSIKSYTNVCSCCKNTCFQIDSQGRCIGCQP